MKPLRKNDLSWGQRLGSAGIGVLLVTYGYAQILRGRPIYRNWLWMDVPALFVVFLGALSFAFAIFPWGRIRFLWDDERHRRNSHR
jgi:hypothetical protein